MRIAAAAYNMDFLDNWQAYEDKLTRWVSGAAGQGAELLVFPEYGAMELATLAGREAAADLEASLHAVSDRMADAAALHATLAARHKLHILAASAPVFDEGSRPVNRAMLFGPGGLIGHQDKQIMTRFEAETWDVVPGGPLRAFRIGDITLGILICFDAEFPALARALIEAGVDILAVPSCTDTLAGYWRVRVGAMARALEGQCVVIHAPTVLPCAWSPAVDENEGAAAIYGPPDLGFPESGIIALGSHNAPGWTLADIDPAAIARVRKGGAVFNHARWPDSDARAKSGVEIVQTANTA